ncbi:MAG: hypothetical protein FWC43_13815 [Planctomycetaceae bacterium]|nr:hypothetical protein [Planctomycetaceae bacterium]
MFLLENYTLAVLFCFITMLCWGSWGNTQKLAGKTWRFELFYWDYVLGVFLLSLVCALTAGNSGELGRGFFADLSQASVESLGWAFLGGVVFNIANILLVAAIAIAGLSVAFPVGIGLALVLGVILNYVAKPEGDATVIFLGVGLIAVAIVINAIAYRKLPGQKSAVGTKGLVLSILCGILMSTFYYFVAKSLAGVELAAGGVNNTVTAATLKEGTLQAGKLTAYTANFIFALGILLSNFIVNTVVMLKPFIGTPVSPFAYFKGTSKDHLWGIIGGGIWGVGMSCNIVASNVASPAIAYGLGQGATLVSAIWGVFIWREFRGAPKGTEKLLAVMFLLFFVGLGLIIYAKI